MISFTSKDQLKTAIEDYFNGSNNTYKISNWDTSQITDMSYMFYKATNFNQPLHFDTSNVTDMHYMFGYAINFNQPLNFRRY